jgi:hypothetical protein
MIEALSSHTKRLVLDQIPDCEILPGFSGECPMGLRPRRPPPALRRFRPTKGPGDAAGWGARRINEGAFEVHAGRTNLSVPDTCRCRESVGRTPGSAADAPVGHPALDQRYSLAALANPARTGFFLDSRGEACVGREAYGDSSAKAGEISPDEQADRGGRPRTGGLPHPATESTSLPRRTRGRMAERALRSHQAAPSRPEKLRAHPCLNP